MNPKSETRERVALLLFSLIAVADDLPDAHTPNLVELVGWFQQGTGSEAFTKWFRSAEKAAKRFRGEKASRLNCSLMTLREVAFHAGLFGD